MIFGLSKNTGQKQLSYWSSNQRNSFTFPVVFHGPRDNAEFVTAILVRRNSPASHVTLPTQNSKFPPSTHYSTALTKFRHNYSLRMYHLATSQTQPKLSEYTLLYIRHQSSSHYQTHLSKLSYASSLPAPYGEAGRGSKHSQQKIYFTAH
jgi:hypothetical protein